MVKYIVFAIFNFVKLYREIISHFKKYNVDMIKLMHIIGQSNNMFIRLRFDARCSGPL